VLSEDEAAVMERLSKGDPVSMWPTGAIKIGKEDADVSIVNSLWREGHLGLNYAPTSQGKRELTQFQKAHPKKP
jgi:hypothetical protein